MTQNIRENIKQGKYKASDPELDPIAYPASHRLNPVQASPDERAAARAQLRQLAVKKKALFRSDLEDEYGVPHDHPKAQLLWERAWDLGHANGLYEVLNHYEDLVDLIL